MKTSDKQKQLWRNWYPNILEENLPNYVVKPVLTDGLVPYGARISVGTAMTRFDTGTWTVKGAVPKLYELMA